MKIKSRYTFRLDDTTARIVEFLKIKKIKYKEAKGIPIVTVEVLDDNKYWGQICDLMNEHMIKPFIESVFSSNEIDTAEWLIVRSKWRSYFPQPEDNFEYKRITYNSEKYCPQCGCGLVQVDNFRLNSAPKWSERNFLMLNWIEDELFISESVEKMLENGKITGVEFRAVVNDKTGEPINNIRQIQVLNKLEGGLLLQTQDIKKEISCDKCHSKKYLLNGNIKLRFDNSVFDSSLDIVKTQEQFGDGLVCLNLILISQNFYKIIKENGWHKDIIVEPVDLVSM